MDYKKQDKTLQTIVMVVVAIAALGIGFGSGVVYQKGKSPKSTVASTDDSAQFGAVGGNLQNGRRGMLGGFGSVKVVSDTSITITNSRTNQDTVYSITSTTKILNGTAAASVSDIKVGDTVIIQPSTTSSTEASQITLNPQMPTGGPGGMQPGGSDMPDTQTN